MTPAAALGFYLREKCEEVMHEAGTTEPRMVVYVAMGLGVQFALELADYDPQLARVLLRSIHQGSPEAADEWYVNARKFAAHCTP
jgi:hypothetical protein